MQKLIEARGIVKRFPGVIALNSVDFDLFPGEVHALCGENGAGKSTLVNVLTGALSADEGELKINGRRTTFNSTGDAQLAGIHVIRQELTFVPQLDVATNLSLGAIPLRRGRIAQFFGIVDRGAILRHADRALVGMGTNIDRYSTAGTLSVAEAQLLEIARAMHGDFRILLFDEPTASLGVKERDHLFERIRRLRQSGVGIVYISHRLTEVLALADRITVIRDGEVVRSDRPENLDLETLVTSITGKRAHQERGTARSKPPSSEVVLEAKGLSSTHRVVNASFQLRRGEVVGVAGLTGAGRTELAQCIYGARPISSGKLFLRGSEIRPQSPNDALALGIGYATEDRKALGIFPLLSVEHNITVGALSRRQIAIEYSIVATWLRRLKLKTLVSELVQGLQIKAPNIALLVKTMSGGNQQKVVLGRLLASRADILILDEPTRGVDVGAKAQIWQLIQKLADDGISSLVISSDIPELVGTVDRVLVMRRGEIVAEIDGNEISEQKVMKHAV